MLSNPTSSPISNPQQEQSSFFPPKPCVQSPELLKPTTDNRQPTTLQPTPGAQVTELRVKVRKIGGLNVVVPLQGTEDVGSHRWAMPIAMLCDPAGIRDARNKDP